MESSHRRGRCVPRSVALPTGHVAKTESCLAAPTRRTGSGRAVGTGEKCDIPDPTGRQRTGRWIRMIGRRVHARSPVPQSAARKAPRAGSTRTIRQKLKNRPESGVYRFLISPRERVPEKYLVEEPVPVRSRMESVKQISITTYINSGGVRRILASGKPSAPRPRSAD